jgi:integrase
MNGRLKIHTRNLKARKENIKRAWKIPDIEKKKFFRFLDESELGKVNKGKKISESRQVKYCDLMKIPLEFWNKAITQLKLKDLEAFENALCSGGIKSKKSGNEFSESTKVDIRKIIKIYFKWRLGEEKALKLTGWLDTKAPTQTPYFLSEEEVEILYRSCRNARERYLVAVLFDSGARAEEFLNIRFEDVFMPNDNIQFVKIALKEEYSKTRGRTISLYWKHSLEAVRDYLKERKLSGIQSKVPIFDGKYDQIRMFLSRLGGKMLKKRVTPHLLRHSSATYYASKLNRQQLCIRYGWTFSSNMPDVYIARAGVDDKELDERMAGVAIEKAKHDFENERVEMKMKHEQLENELKDFKIKLNKLVNVLSTLQAGST